MAVGVLVGWTEFIQAGQDGPVVGPQAAVHPTVGSTSAGDVPIAVVPVLQVAQEALDVGKARTPLPGPGVGKVADGLHCLSSTIRPSSGCLASSAICFKTWLPLAPCCICW